MSRILVVDDDPEMLQVTKQWLEFEKHSVETSDTGIAGSRQLETGTYDLVLLDWDLPDINGIDILKKYRAGGGQTPVLMLTGRSDIDFKCEGLDSGADDYVTKPFHMKELLSRIRAILSKSDRLAHRKEVPGSNQKLLSDFDLKGSELAARFEIIEVLGEGAFGVLLKARNPELDKAVAIKMIRKAEDSEENRLRFKHEAKAVSELDHKNIARLFDFGITEKQQFYMIMEFISGLTLEKILAKEERLCLEKALPLFIQIADGISHAHKMNILHRDLKPSNVILKDPSAEPWVKVLDFGCAKFCSDSNRAQPSLTKQGQLVGSPLYMSPEQVQGQELDCRSDIYSLGCLMYEMLTGKAPHLAEDAISVMVKHVSESPKTLCQTCPDVQFPNRLEALVARSLARDPSMRFATMLELKSELELLQSELLSSSVPKQNQKQNLPWWQKLFKKSSEQ